MKVQDLHPRGKAVAGRAWRLLVAAMDVPLRYFFGRDIFISYSRADAAQYAPNLALALQAKRPKLSFYLDKWMAPPSGALPPSLMRQVRWSDLLVVICTKNAVLSDFVKDEIETFSRLPRKIVPIDVDRAFLGFKDNDDVWRAIGGAVPEAEEQAAMSAGHPSEHVIERILKSVDFTVQDRRLKRAVWGTLGFVAIVIIGTTFYSKVTIQKAHAEADRQQQIALVRRLANQSELDLAKDPSLLVRSLARAIEAASRAKALGIFSLEADTALRNGLAWLPRSLPTAPDLAMNAPSQREVSEVSAGKSIHVKEVHGRRSWDVPSDEDTILQVALTPNGKYLAVSFGDESHQSGFVRMAARCQGERRAGGVEPGPEGLGAGGVPSSTACC
jgi:hypothetical protein